MEQNLSNKEILHGQIRDIYGKVVYSYTTHIKDSKIIVKRNNHLKLLNIILSAFSTGGLIAVIVDWNTLLCAILTAILTTSILVVSTYLKYANLEQIIGHHRKTATDLWPIREKVVSLLIDFDLLSYEEIVVKRDTYINELSVIYSSEIDTSEKAYRHAKKALKNDEEQFFTDEEIDIMLPEVLRKKKHK